MRERRALAGHAGHGGGEGRQSRLRLSPLSSTMSCVASERTPLAHAGTLTERVAAGGHNAGGRVGRAAGALRPDAGRGHQ